MLLTGPPIAPRITASADLAAVRASSVNGEPVASMEAWGMVVQLGALGAMWGLGSAENSRLLASALES